MVRFILRTLISVAASAIGLLIAAGVLDGMTIDGSAFIIAVIIFTITAALVQPFLQKQAMRSAQALMGASALLSTLIALIVTHLVSSGLSISGLSTWLYATLIVWFATMIANWLIPLILVKNGVESLRERR